MFSSLGSGTAENTGLSEINEDKRATPECLPRYLLYGRSLFTNKQTGSQCTKSLVNSSVVSLFTPPPISVYSKYSVQKY